MEKNNTIGSRTPITLNEDELQGPKPHYCSLVEVIDGHITVEAIAFFGPDEMSHPLDYKDTVISTHAYQRMKYWMEDYFAPMFNLFTTFPAHTVDVAYLHTHRNPYINARTLAVRFSVIDHPSIKHTDANHWINFIATLIPEWLPLHARDNEMRTYWNVRCERKLLTPKQIAEALVKSARDVRSTGHEPS